MRDKTRAQKMADPGAMGHPHSVPDPLRPTQPFDAEAVLSDPVAYLRSFGLDAELVEELGERLVPAA